MVCSYRHHVALLCLAYGTSGCGAPSTVAVPDGTTVNGNVVIMPGTEVFDGSGVSGTLEHSIGDVVGVEVHAALPVTVSASNDPRVQVLCDDNLLEHITIESFTNERDGASVRIAHGLLAPKTACRIDVWAPALNHVVLRGSGDVTVSSAHGALFAGVVEGSGSMTASGAADQAKWSVTGSGDVHAEALIADQVDAVVTGSGNITTHATTTANLTIVGSGNITLQGGADVQERITGSGAIHRLR